MDEERPESQPESERQPPASKPENGWIEILKTLGLSAVLALGIRSFVAEARYIPSGSMLPTLQINDRLIVDKISYRFSDPARGDIIVFMPPDRSAQICTGAAAPITDAYIKRIIGIPGDRIEIKNGRVYVNGKILAENYIQEPPNYSWSSQQVAPDGKIPPNNYLVLGDNRNNSCDGHMWGVVSKERIIGKATVRFWPIDRAGGIDPQPDYR